MLWCGAGGGGPQPPPLAPLPSTVENQLLQQYPLAPVPIKALAETGVTVRLRPVPHVLNGPPSKPLPFRSATMIEFEVPS